MEYNQLSYRDGLSSVGGELREKYSKKRYSADGVSIYEEGYKAILDLGKTETSLLIYYMDRMSDLNVIRTDTEYREYFNEFLESNGQKKVADVTIRRTISKLIEVGLMVKLRRAKYRINPFMITKTSVDKEQRENIMRLYMKESGEIKPDFAELEIKE